MVSLQSSVQLALVVGRASRLCLALHSAVVAALIFVTLVGLHSVKDVMALQAEWADDGVMANSDRHGVGVVRGARASPSATFCHSVPFSRSSEWVEAGAGGAGGATLRVWWRGPARILCVTIRYAAVCVWDGADPPARSETADSRVFYTSFQFIYNRIGMVSTPTGFVVVLCAGVVSLSLEVRLRGDRESSQRARRAKRVGRHEMHARGGGGRDHGRGLRWRWRPSSAASSSSRGTR